MAKVIAGVHPVHLKNADLAPGGRQPLNQAIFYCYLARKLVLFFT